jgi:hypothetical protein
LRRLPCAHMHLTAASRVPASSPSLQLHCSQSENKFLEPDGSPLLRFAPHRASGIGSIHPPQHRNPCRGCPATPMHLAHPWNDCLYAEACAPPPDRPFMRACSALAPPFWPLSPHLLLHGASYRQMTGRMLTSTTFLERFALAFPVEQERRVVTQALCSGRGRGAAAALGRGRRPRQQGPRARVAGECDAKRWLRPAAWRQPAGCEAGGVVM